jgi:hypothetical protein
MRSISSSIRTEGDIWVLLADLKRFIEEKGVKYEADFNYRCADCNLENDCQQLMSANPATGLKMNH